MKKINLLVAIGIAFGVANGNAQDTVSISTNDLLQKVTEKNLQMKIV